MEPQIIKRDAARCQKIAEDLDHNGPYGLVWFHDHACVWTKYLNTKITIWIADLVDAKGLYVASSIRDDERYAYLTHENLMVAIYRAKQIADIINHD